VPWISNMMASDSSDLTLSVLSYNMHGFRQGVPALEDIVSILSPSILLLQEHWLTPANLYKFDQQFNDYFSFGCSAMSSVVESGILRGRPFGGVITLVNNKLRTVTETIVCEERFVLIRVANVLIVNVYFPCHGTPDRKDICIDLLQEISSWIHRFPNCECIVAGDFNCSLDTNDTIANSINSFINVCALKRCDHLFSSDMKYTYVNQALNSQSYIDYALVSSANSLTDFSILDPDINFSDHLPVWLVFTAKISSYDNHSSNLDHSVFIQRYPRWDKADRGAYYEFTRSNLDQLSDQLDQLLAVNDVSKDCIDNIYSSIVCVLLEAEARFVPKRSKGFFKFWWNEELDIFKKASIDTNTAWKLAGKPRSGPIFNNRQKARTLYRKSIREYEARSVGSYTNDLHEALLRKDGTAFWKCWHSNFEPANRCTEVENSVDPPTIVQKFAAYFSEAYKPNSVQKAQELRHQYENMRLTYCGLPLTEEHIIDSELVSKVMFNLHCGKAPDATGLTAEHLRYSHPSLPVILCKLFRLIMLCKYIPSGFCNSYIVPVPKIKDSRSKKMTCEDFRGIAISPVISKVFEHCILDKFKKYFTSSNEQFGFKKGYGCRHAIYTVRTVIERINKGGSTANICAIDLSKAFDKVNHCALYMKLMKRHTPVELLKVLENWLSKCFASVKWSCFWSSIFSVSFGVRQGSVLSPVLFAVYIDDICKLSNVIQGTTVVLYADDILLIAPSVSVLQKLLLACEEELDAIDMVINAKKSSCVRVGPRHNVTCAEITTSDGNNLLWVNEMRYLGIFIVCHVSFRCSTDHAKRSFYRAANAIFAKVGRFASEEVILELIIKKCVPILTYGLEVCALPRRVLHSLDFTINRVLMKLFKTSNIEIIEQCRYFFNIELPSVQLERRFEKFLVNA